MMPLPTRYYPWNEDADESKLDALPLGTTVAVDYGHGRQGRMIKVFDHERPGREWRSRGSGKAVRSEFVASMPWRVIPVKGERVSP